MRFPTLLCLLTLLLAAGCDRSEGLRLVGAWEGTPARGAIGVQVEQPIESCRFEFQRSGQAVITLRLAEQEDRTAQANWQVVDSGLEELTLLITLPAEGESEARSTQLKVEFDGDDRLVASELGGDYRVPAMNLVREGSEAARVDAEKAAEAQGEAEPQTQAAEGE